MPRYTVAIHEDAEYRLTVNAANESAACRAALQAFLNGSGIDSLVVHERQTSVVAEREAGCRLPVNPKGAHS